VPLRVYPGMKTQYMLRSSPFPTSTSFPFELSLPARHPPRRPHLARRPGPHRPSNSVSGYPDRDEPPDESSDVCGEPWVSLDFHLVRALSVLSGFHVGRVLKRRAVSAFVSVSTLRAVYSPEAHILVRAFN
jgi:hypothetical protein